jgi:hypothetical protein
MRMAKSAATPRSSGALITFQRCFLFLLVDPGTVGSGKGGRDRRATVFPRALTAAGAGRRSTVLSILTPVFFRTYLRAVATFVPYFERGYEDFTTDLDSTAPANEACDEPVVCSPDGPRLANPSASCIKSIVNCRLRPSRSAMRFPQFFITSFTFNINYRAGQVF